MSVSAGPFGAEVEREILAGHGPSRSSIGRVAGAHLDTLGALGRAAAEATLLRHLIGLGPLSTLAADPSVTDIMLNGDGSVWVERGGVLEPGGPPIETSAGRPLAVRLAGLAGRRLDDAQPWVDGVLPGGVRLHAVLPPIAQGGACISLRFPRARAAGVAALAELGVVGPDLARVLLEVVTARVSFVVTGGTGAGKTTVLAALLAECSPRERLVVVEDVRELRPEHPHVVSLEGRSPNVEGAGGVTLVDLVRQALRMRPDRLVVGEVRGAEVRELLTALNTGHDGGASTLHANGPQEVPARLEALGALAGMSREAVHSQLRGALQVVVHLSRHDGARRVSSIGVVRTSGSGEVEVVVAARPGGGGLVGGPGRGALLALLPGVAGCEWLDP